MSPIDTDIKTCQQCEKPLTGRQIVFCCQACWALSRRKVPADATADEKANNRTCEQCATPLVRRKGEAHEAFRERRWCGHACTGLSRRKDKCDNGHPESDMYRSKDGKVGYCRGCRREAPQRKSNGHKSNGHKSTPAPGQRVIPPAPVTEPVYGFWRPASWGPVEEEIPSGVMEA